MCLFVLRLTVVCYGRSARVVVIHIILSRAPPGRPAVALDPARVAQQTGSVVAVEADDCGHAAGQIRRGVEHAGAGEIAGWPPGLGALWAEPHAGRAACRDRGRVPLRATPLWFAAPVRRMINLSCRSSRATVRPVRHMGGLRRVPPRRHAAGRDVRYGGQPVSLKEVVLGGCLA